MALASITVDTVTKVTDISGQTMPDYSKKLRAGESERERERARESERERERARAL